jgi:hypothetical protein
VASVRSIPRTASRDDVARELDAIVIDRITLEGRIEIRAEKLRVRRRFRWTTFLAHG